MRNIPDVLAAKSGQDANQTALTVQALPPAYMKGFTLASRDNQLIVSPGTGNIRGKRTTQRQEYIIQGSDFVASDNIITGIFYTVYVNSALEYKVDSVDPVKDDDFFAYYHPTLYEFRYIGQFYLGVGHIYQQIISYDPLEFNSVNTNLVETLLLAVKSQVLIGYEGTGSYENPHEGDNTIYIDGDEIIVQEYAGGAWLPELRFGGNIDGSFISQIQGNTVNHIDNDSISTEVFPTKNHLVFTFDNTYDDHNGQDDWLGKTNTGFTTAWSKFGTYSLQATASGATLFGPFYGDVGDNVSMSIYCKLNLTSGATVGLMGFTYSTTDQIVIFIEPAYNRVTVTIKKGGGTLWDFTINVAQFGGMENVEYIGFTYNADTDTLSLIVNNVIKTQSGFSGTWTPSVTWQMQVSPYLSGSDYIYLSELTMSYVDYVNPQILAVHYNHQKAWETDVSRADQAIYCAPGGRIRFIDHMPEESLGTLHMLEQEDRPTTSVGATTSTSWSVVDFSAYVPFGAKAILLRVQLEMSSGANSITMLCRPKGSTVVNTNQNSRFYVYRNSTSSNDQTTMHDPVLCSVDGCIEIRLSISGSRRASITIEGYYI
jgi:hypothetical protein